jgi:hypothetical protein
MLFLAVFCGFYAEYQLEHKFEKDRAKELARSFYDELASDAVAVNSAIENRVRKETAIDYLKKYFMDSSFTQVSNTFTINFNYGLLSHAPSIFEPRDVILEQLINSGSLRYFKNRELQKLTGDFHVAISRVRKRNEIEWIYNHENLYPFIIKHNDQAWYDIISDNGQTGFSAALKNYEHSGKVIPFNFNNPGDFNRKEAINMIGLYQLIFRGSRQKLYHEYDSLNRLLQDVIRKEYNIN